MRPRHQLVEKGNYHDTFPPSKDALLGVNGSASHGAGHKGSQGVLDEEMLSTDDDEPDD
jgi:hypothetical protein